MFRGSKNYPSFRSISRAFEWLGGEWNAATGHEHTEYWFSGNAGNKQGAINLFSDFLQPKLNDLDIESRKKSCKKNSTITVTVQIWNINLK